MASWAPLVKISALQLDAFLVFELSTFKKHFKKVDFSGPKLTDFSRRFRKNTHITTLSITIEGRNFNHGVPDDQRTGG